MKYSKLQDVEGLQFNHKNSKDLLYTITAYKDRTMCIISWEYIKGDPSTSLYNIKDVLTLLNKGTWVPVNKPDQYDIF